MQKINFKILKGDPLLKWTDAHFIEKQGYILPIIEGLENLELVIVKIDLFKEGEKFYLFDKKSGLPLNKELYYNKKSDIKIDEIKEKIITILCSKYGEFYKTTDYKIILCERIKKSKDILKENNL